MRGIVMSPRNLLQHEGYIYLGIEVSSIIVY